MGHAELSRAHAQDPLVVGGRDTTGRQREVPLAGLSTSASYGCSGGCGRALATTYQRGPGVASGSRSSRLTLLSPKLSRTCSTRLGRSWPCIMAVDSRLSTRASYVARTACRVRRAAASAAVHTGDDVDPGLQQLLHVLPPLGVAGAATGRVGVGELVHQHNLGATGQHRVEVHLGELGSPVGHRTPRHRLQALGHGRGRSPPVRLGETRDHVGASGTQTPAFFEHESVRLPHRGLPSGRSATVHVPSPGSRRLVALIAACLPPSLYPDQRGAARRSPPRVTDEATWAYQRPRQDDAGP